jgi:hypothetical protein
MNHLPECLIGAGTLAQAAVPSAIDAGSIIGAMAPSALLGIGIWWAIRRGDQLVSEIHALREKHEDELKGDREEFKAILKHTTETLTRVNSGLAACEERRRVIEEEKRRLHELERQAKT